MKNIILPMLNVCAKAAGISWLVANTLELYGVQNLGWLILLSLPLSFALYLWLGILQEEPEPPVKKGLDTP